MKFNKVKFKVMYLGWGNLQYQHSLEKEWIESSPVEKDLGIPLDEKLDLSQQCALVAQKGNRVLGCIKRSVARRSREVIYPTLVRPHLEYCIQLWSPQHERHGPVLGQTFQQGLLR